MCKKNIQVYIYEDTATMIEDFEFHSSLRYIQKYLLGDCTAPQRYPKSAFSPKIFDNEVRKLLNFPSYRFIILILLNFFVS